MKLAITASIIALLASPALADVEFSTSIRKDNLSASVSFKEADISKAKVGVTYLQKDLNENWRSRVYTGYEYDFILERSKIVNDIRFTRKVTNKFSVFVQSDVDYVFGGYRDYLAVGPSIGASYSLADNVSIYGDISASFDATDGFEHIGNEFGLGIWWGITDNFGIAIGATRNHDTDWEEKTDIYVSAGYSF